MAPLLGADIKQIINQLHWKPAGSLISDFAFHQDARFRKPLACYRNLAESYVQTGIAIESHTVESGALRVLPEATGWERWTWAWMLLWAAAYRRTR